MLFDLASEFGIDLDKWERGHKKIRKIWMESLMQMIRAYRTYAGS